MSKAQDMRKLMESVGKLLPKKSILNEEGIDNATGEHNLKQDREFFNKDIESVPVNEATKVSGEYATTIEDFPVKGDATEVIIYYNILGTYHPATMEDPEEHPEVEYDEVIESATGLDISAQFVDFMENNDVMLQKLDKEIFAHEDEKSNHFKDDYEESSKPFPGKMTVTETRKFLEMGRKLMGEVQIVKYREAKLK